MYSRPNCCRRNFPMPINCCCFSNSLNVVSSPTLATTTSQYGFFAGAGGAVAEGELIPLTLVSSSGTTISPSVATTGAVNLLAGRYLVNYAVGATAPTGGVVSTSLTLNGVLVSNSTATENQTAGDAANLGQTVILDIPQTSTLALANTSPEEVTFTSANLTITRL